MSSTCSYSTAIDNVARTIAHPDNMARLQGKLEGKPVNLVDASIILGLAFEKDSFDVLSNLTEVARKYL